MTGWDAVGKVAKITAAALTGVVLAGTVVAASIYNLWRDATRDDPWRSR